MEVSGGSKSDEENFQRGHWKFGEDEKLRKIVIQHGPKNWNFIAKQFVGRSGKSCRLRWYNQLDPNINKRPFTKEEEERLLKAHSIQGNKWASIARKFPGRTDNAVKNHFHVIMARRKREKDVPSTYYTCPSVNNMWYRHSRYRTMHTQDYSFPYCNPHLGSSSVWSIQDVSHLGNENLVGLDKYYTSHQTSDKSSYEDGFVSNLGHVGGKNENDKVTFIDFLGVGLDSH